MLITMKKWVQFLLISVFIPVMSAAGDIDAAKESMKDMFLIQNRADMYFMLNDLKYPVVNNMTEFVKAVEPITKHLRNNLIPMKDAWGNEFQYRCDSERKNIWIISYGSDGKADTDVYDASEIPMKEEYPDSSDAKSDIISKNGEFILRNPAAEKAAYDELKVEFKNRNNPE